MQPQNHHHHHPWRVARAYRRAIGLGGRFAAGLAPGPGRAYARAYLDFLTGAGGEEPEAARRPDAGGLSPEAAARIRGHLRGLMFSADEEFLRCPERPEPPQAPPKEP